MKVNPIKMKYSDIKEKLIVADALPALSQIDINAVQSE